MNRRHFVRALAVACAPALAGCGGTGAPALDRSEELPMALDGVHASVEVQVNGRRLRFLLDSGADGSVIALALAREMGLPLSDTVTPISGGGGPAAPVPSAAVRELRVGMSEWRDITLYAVDLGVAFPCDGLLGADFFRAQTVALDYDRGVLRLGAGAPIGEPAWLPLELQPSGKALVHAELAEIGGWFSVDSGAAQAVTIFRPAADALGLRQRFAPALRMITGHSVGGPVRGDLVRAPRLRLGDFEWNDPLVELSLAEGGLFGSAGWLGNIGGDVLRRLQPTFDYRAARLGLSAGRAFGQRFAGPRVGAALQWSDALPQVIEVVPGSPAAAAGLAVGDTIRAVDGADITLGTRAFAAALRRAFAQPAGTVVLLELLRAGAPTRQARLELRELI